MLHIGNHSLVYLTGCTLSLLIILLLVVVHRLQVLPA